MQSVSFDSKAVKLGNARNNQEIEFFANQGFAFVPVVGRGKTPIEQNWQNQPWTLAEIVKHAGNIGVLLGKPSGRIICIDADRDVDALMKKHPIFGNTLTVRRKNAPGRAKFFFRVTDQLPRSASHSENKKPVIELLATGRQAVVVGVHPDGCEYECNFQPVAPITYEVLDSIWLAETGDELRHPINANKKTVSITESTNTLAKFINANVTCLEIVRWLGLDAQGLRKERNGETRILGNGGLLIDENRNIWINHSAEVGGDPIALYTFYTLGKVKMVGQEFIAVCAEMAERKGIALPKYEREIGFDPDTALDWAVNHRSYPDNKRHNPFDRAMMVALLQLMIDTRKDVVKFSVRDAAERSGMSIMCASRTINRLIEYGLIEAVDANGCYLRTDSKFDQFVGSKFEARMIRLSDKLRSLLGTVRSTTGAEAGNVSSSVIDTTVYLRYLNHDAFSYGAKIDGTDEGVAKIALDIISVLSKENDLTSAEIATRINRGKTACTDALGTLTLLGILERTKEGRAYRYHLVDAWEDNLEKMSSGVSTYGTGTKRKISHLSDRINMVKRALCNNISVKLANHLEALAKGWARKRTMLIDEFNRLMQIKQAVFAV